MSRGSSEKSGGYPKGRVLRKTNEREVKKQFLLVCEGAKTETRYFEAFGIPQDEIDIKGEGQNTLSLIDRALEYQKSRQYVQVWCVFDRDAFPADRFNNALSKARQNKIRVAYSNEAFELWYLLHFEYYDAALHRSAYGEKLSEKLEVKYEKNIAGMYEKLLKKQATAIDNAKRLMRSYNPSNPEKDNPSTTVYQLVEALNQFLKENAS